MDNVAKSKEYAVLLREHKELVAEHERLEANPYDQEAHIEHRQRLISHNKRLHDFVVTHFTGPKPPDGIPGKDQERRAVRRGKTRKRARPGRPR